MYHNPQCHLGDNRDRKFCFLFFSFSSVVDGHKRAQWVCVMDGWTGKGTLSEEELCNVYRWYVYLSMESLRTWRALIAVDPWSPEVHSRRHLVRRRMDTFQHNFFILPRSLTFTTSTSIGMAQQEYGQERWKRNQFPP